MATHIEYWLPDCLQASDGLHRHLLTSRVLHCNLDGGVGTLVIKLHDINQVCFAFESRASNAYCVAGAEFIGECRFGSVVTRILARTQPLVIDLCCHTTGEDGLTTPRP